jgi:hypothetical protein
MRHVAGRKAHGRCVAATANNHAQTRCTRTITAGALTFNAHEGANATQFSGRVSANTKLTPGRYTLQITATNAQGEGATPQALGFTIVKGGPAT